MTSHITYTLYIRTSPDARETRLDLGQDEPVTLTQARDLAIGRSVHAIEALRPYYVAVYRDDLAYPIAVYQNGELLEDNALENTTLRCRTCKDTGTVQTVESDGEAAYEEACPDCDMPHPHDGMSGVDRIAAERHRQIEVKGYTPQHDRGHDAGEQARAAACYILHSIYPNSRPDTHRVWPQGWMFKPGNAIRDLEKAGGLIAAELDRLTGWPPRQDERDDEESETAGEAAAVSEPVSYEFDILTADQADGSWCSIQPSDPPFFAREAITAAELANRVIDQHVAETADGDEFHVRVVVWAAGEHPDGEQLAVAETHHKAAAAGTVFTLTEQERLLAAEAARAAIDGDTGCADEDYMPALRSLLGHVSRPDTRSISDPHELVTLFNALLALDDDSFSCRQDVQALASRAGDDASCCPVCRVHTLTCQAPDVYDKPVMKAAP